MNTIIVFFLKFILVPLVIVIAITILNYIVKIKKAFNIKKVIIILLLATLALTIPVLFSLMNYEFVWVGLIFTIISYFFSGIFFLFFKDTKYYKSTGLDNNSHSLFFLLIISILTGWIYYLLFPKLSGLNFAIYAMFLVLWVTIPLLYIIALNHFINIPRSFYKPWYIDKTIDNQYWENVDVFKLIQVNVKIKRNTLDKEYSSFSVKLPLEVTLGKWFNRFVDDHNFRFPNKTIDSEIDGEQIGWIFYTNKWFNVPLLTKVLDSDENGKVNKIKNKRTIYVRRTKLNTN